MNKMKIYKIGEKSKGVCDECKKTVIMTFHERTVPLSSGRGEISGILAGVCDECDQVISIPQQSVPRIQDVLKPKKSSIEARLPRHLLDILACACAKLGAEGGGEEAGAVLFRYYIEVLGTDQKKTAHLKKLLQDDLAYGPATGRYSLKVSKPIQEIFESLISRTHLSKTDLLKGILLQMKKDLLEGHPKSKITEIRRVVLAAI